MWDMAALLTPAGRANLAAVSAALPAPPLPADPHATAAGSDARSGAALLFVKLSEILTVATTLEVQTQAGLTNGQWCFRPATRVEQSHST